MPISKKKPLATKSGALDRVIRKIYDDINELISAVNTLAIENRGEIGKKGDIRLAKREDGAYYIEARGDDGWYTTASLDVRTKYND